MTQILEEARRVLTEEEQSLRRTREALGETFERAVAQFQKSLARGGRVIVTGMGKSGHIGSKIASTLASTGTSAFFLHPTEALHGDFGMISKDDALLAIAYGGETKEVLSAVQFAKRQGIPVVAITGALGSSLAREADLVLDGSVPREADHLGMVPTSSALVALALGDALASVLMKERGFTREHFARLHPGGLLGRKLSAVEELMHPRSGLISVGQESSFHEILKAVAHRNFGIVPVLGEGHRLLGCITDGDLRRALITHGAQALDKRARELMHPNPRTVPPQERVMEGLALMEQVSITSLFVVAVDSGQLLGLLRLHDILAL